MTTLIITGLPRHGKSTVGRFIAEATGRTYADTSYSLYQTYAEEKGIPLADVLKLPKESIRPDLVRIGDSLCAQDPAGLITDNVKRGASVIVGARRAAEFKRFAATHDATLAWVERDDVPFIKDNTEASLLRRIAELNGILIPNFRTLEDLRNLTYDLAKLYAW